MKRLLAVLIGAALIGGYLVGARAEDTTSWMERLKKTTGELVSALPMPSISLPTMPDFSMPDFTKMGDGIMGEFNVFTQQVAESLPILEDMGYEVSTFRVQWGLPPKAKLRLRSKEGTDPARIAAVIARPINGVLAKTLISSAAEAKRIQSTLKFGTAIIDVDFALPPKVKMSFLKAQKDAPQAVEDLDLACGQALN